MPNPPATSHESTIRASYSAFDARDWESFTRLLAADFTFTTQYDVHIPLDQYRTKCWDVVQEIGPFEILSILEQGDEAMVRYKGHINGMDVQNIEYFKFEHDKIKSIDVFFGRPNN